jgi:hypothetical protein
MFASNSIAEHVARGVIGVAACVVAVWAAPAHAWLSFLALPVALFAFRGCPMCWTVGLVETVAAKVQGRSTVRACVDGSCMKRDGARRVRGRSSNWPGSPIRTPLSGRA